MSALAIARTCGAPAMFRVCSAPAVPRKCRAFAAVHRSGLPARAPHHARGFTLLEVLLVLAIVSVLTAIALPAYSSYITQARRVEGQVALLLLMQQQERYFSQNNSYIAFSADATEPAARRFQWWSGGTAETSAYELLGQPCEGQSITACVELRATPGTLKVDRHFRDGACGMLSLGSDGVQKASGTGAHCWP